MGKYLSIPATKCSGESFCNCFSCTTQNGTVLGGESPGIGGQDRGVLCQPRNSWTYLPNPGAPLAPAPWWLSVTGGLTVTGAGYFSPVEPLWWKAWCLTLRQVGPEGSNGVCIKPFQETCHLPNSKEFGNSLVQYPACLQVRIASCLVLQGLRVYHRASLKGSQHLGMPCLVPFLPFLCLGLPLLFSIRKDILGCLDHLI